MNAKMKKIMACLLTGATMVTMFTACGTDKNAGRTEDGKVLLKVGGAPDPEVKPKQYENFIEKVGRFEEKYPNVKVEPDYWSFDVRSYSAKAEGGTLPTVYYVPLTEATRIMDLGYAADISDELKKRGLYDYISDFMMENISRDGKVYFYPQSVYDVGLAMNIDLLEQAGYVSEDGTPHQPKDWHEMAEMAQKVKQVTGKNGFIFPTMGNTGGWRFTPIAWSYGVEFMKQDDDGSWKATFDSPECVEALQFIKDLKWKYDVLPSNTLIDNKEVQKQMGLGESAITLSEVSMVDKYASYGINPDNIGMVKIPAGPKRHVSLLGGDYRVINKDATPEQISAALDWLEFDGGGRTLTDEKKESIQKNINTRKEDNKIVGIIGLSAWNNGDEVIEYTRKTQAEQTNINLNHVKLYNDKTGIEYQEEEPVEAQALYALLDTCVQEVLNNRDADCAELIKKAAADFQANYLDYAE